MPSRPLLATLALGLIAASAAACSAPKAAGDRSGPVSDPAAQIERGKYLVTVMDCGGCHNNGAFTPTPPTPDKFLAGSEIGFDMPGMGVFYPPNLTPDPETGKGKWSEADLIKAIRTGERPDGRMLAPIMAWHNYATLTDEDAASVAAFLKSLPPQKHAVPGPSSVETAPTPYLTVISADEGRKRPKPPVAPGGPPMATPTPAPAPKG
jgi:mono/diheme cytochrome c family protein